MTRKWAERRLVSQGLVGLTLTDRNLDRQSLLEQIGAVFNTNEARTPEELTEHDRPFVSIAPAIALAWAECGFPKVEPSHKLAASLMATSMPDEIIDELEMPWRCFGIVIPAGLLDPDEHFALVLKRQTDGGYMVFSSLPSGIHVGFEPRLSSLAEKLIPRTSPDGAANPDDMPPVAWRHSELMLRLVLGVIAEFDERRPSAPTISSHDARKILKKQDERLFRGHTFKLMRNVLVDARTEIARYASGESNRSITVRSLIRGHWKQQVHGKDRSGRKLIHVEPYWRGDESLPIALRSHVVRGEPGAISPVRNVIRFVYFLQAGANGPIKIGHSTDVQRRVDSLQTGNPALIQVLGKIAMTDAELVERRLHRELADLRLEGEWFACHQRVFDALASLNAQRMFA